MTLIPRQPCPVTGCSALHGVVSDKPRRGPAKPAREPYTGPTVSPRRAAATALRSHGQDPTATPRAVGVLSEAAERPSTSGEGLTP